MIKNPKMEFWNWWNTPELYKEVEILLKDGTIEKDMMIKGKYGNYEWRNYTDRAVLGWREITENKTNKKENKTMMKNTRENRVATMQAAGIDTKKYFSINLPEGLKPGSMISLVIDENGNPVFTSENMSMSDHELDEYNEIAEMIKNKYVRNSKLHRRWVMAQMFKMLNYRSYFGNGYNAYLNNCYDYRYQFEMLIDELKVLGILAKEDHEAFEERVTFFHRSVMKRLCYDYYCKLKDMVNKLPERNHKGRPYKRISNIDIHVDELDKKLFNPIMNCIHSIDDCVTYDELSMTLRMFTRKFVNVYKLPYDTMKCAKWKDAYKGAGAYYTLMNMVKFHDCFIIDENSNRLKGMKAVNYLKKMNIVHEGYGYRMFAMMKKVIKDNNFDFNQRMKEIYVNE